MRINPRAALLAAGLAVAALPATAQQVIMGPPMVGGGAMYPTADIIDNASRSNDHTILVAAIKAAGLVDTLKGPGPFTVFAPTDEAFRLLPPGTLDSLLMPQNKPQLVKILENHVIGGTVTTAALTKMIDAGGGHATLTTLAGSTLTVGKAGPLGFTITDGTGEVGQIIYPDLMQSNGVIQVVDKVLLPN